MSGRRADIHALGAADRQSATYPLVWVGDIAPSLDQRALIRGVIQSESFICTYGESGCGKTNHVLDRDLCLASGRDFYGLGVERGLVVYVAAEGVHSVLNRAYACRRERAREDDDIQLAIVPAPIDLLTPGADTVRFPDFVKRTQDEYDLCCVKVTVDTLSRAMPGGNENAPDDMTRFIRHSDHVRRALGCSFELVHHAGKDAARGARGHSSLRAALDTEFEVTNRDGYHIARVTKQRDLEAAAEFAFRLKVVELGKDAGGHPVTTVIPQWIEDHEAKAPERRLPDQAKRLLWLLREGIENKGETPPTAVVRGAERPPSVGQKGMSGDALRAWVEERGGISDADKADTRQRAVRRQLQTLQKLGFISIFSDFVWLADIPDKSGYR